MHTFQSEQLDIESINDHNIVWECILHTINILYYSICITFLYVFYFVYCVLDCGFKIPSCIIELCCLYLTVNRILLESDHRIYEYWNDSGINMRYFNIARTGQWWSSYCWKKMRFYDKIAFLRRLLFFYTPNITYYNYYRRSTSARTCVYMCV